MRAQIPGATSFFLATGLLISSAACPAKQPGPSATQPGAAGGDDGADTSVAVAPVEHPEQLLPAQTQLLMVGKSPRRAAEVFGRDRFAKNFPDLYKEAAGVSLQALGHDVLDPASLPAMGIDPEGRFGFAVIDAEQEAFAAFVTLSDPAKFREAAIAAASRHQQQLVPTSLGGSEVLAHESGEVAVVIRPPFGVFVLVDRDEGAPEMARTIATIDPGQALAGGKAYQRAMAATTAGDLTGFIDAAGMVQQQVDRQRRYRSEADARAKEELDEAKKGGQTPEELAEIEARAKKQQAFEDSYAKRQQAEIELAELLFSGVEGIALRADAKRTGAVVEMRAALTDDAFLRRLLRGRKGEPPLAWALDGAPLLLLSAGMDTDAFFEMFELFARSEGTTTEETSKELADKTGVTLDDLKPLLTGKAGGALVIEGEAKMSNLGKAPKWLGFSVYAEVEDPAKAKALLDAAAAKTKPFGKPAKRDRGIPGFYFDVPDWRRVYVTVGGRYVVVTTDRELPKRLAKGKAGTIEQKATPASAYAAMKLPDTAVTYAADMATFGWLTFGTLSMDVPPLAAETAAASAVPKSRAWKKKKKELEKLDEKIQKERAKLEAEQAESVLAMIRPIGMTVFSVRLEDRGLWATGGQFVRAEGIPGAVDAVARKAVDLMGARSAASSKQDEVVQRLFEKRSALQVELEELRQKDIERFEKRKSRR